MEESCHIWTRHVIYEWVASYMNELCHTHVTNMNESCHTYEWVVSHINQSCHTCERVMSYMNESCHIWTCHIWISHVTCEQVVSHMTSHFTTQWIMPHINKCHKKHVTYWATEEAAAKIPPLKYTNTQKHDNSINTHVFVYLSVFYMNESCHIWTNQVVYVTFRATELAAAKIPPPKSTNTWNVTHMNEGCHI